MKLLTCKNHTDLRWTTKGAGHSLFFIGNKDRKPEMSTTPFKLLKARLDGVNPFNQSLKSPDGPVTTWEGAVEAFEAVKRMTEFYAFECECPASDLIEIEEDTK